MRTSQATSKATPCAIPEGIGDLRQSSVKHGVGWARDQATSRGSLGEYSAISHRPIGTKQRPNQHPVLPPGRFVTTWSWSDSSGPGRPDLCSAWYAWTTASRSQIFLACLEGPKARRPEAEKEMQPKSKQGRRKTKHKKEADQNGKLKITRQHDRRRYSVSGSTAVQMPTGGTSRHRKKSEH